MKQKIIIVALFLLAFAGGYILPLNSGNFKASILQYGEEGSNLEDDVVRFNLQMNEITNKFLEGLIETENPNVDYPASVDDCDEDNVSTFCLAVVLNEELTAFEKGMILQKERYRDDSDPSDLNIRDALKLQSKRASLADTEIDAARKSVDLTLAVYNQAQVVYPVHKEFVRMIGNLEEYRDNLARIRDWVELYPSRFVNATTLQCK